MKFNIGDTVRTACTIELHHARITIWVGAEGTVTHVGPAIRSERYISVSFNGMTDIAIKQSELKKVTTPCASSAA